jgi:hypothetical protein
MTQISLQQVNTGTGANTGTGDTLLRAFTITDQNFNNIEIAINSLISSSALTISSFSQNIAFNSGTISTNPSTGSLVVNGGAGVTGNVNVGGDISGKQITVNDTYTGTLIVNGGAGVTGNVNVGGDISINGSLTVFGNTTTISTSEYIVQHPTIQLGGANLLNGPSVTLSSNDGYDRGIDFYWYNISQHQGFFGLQNSTGRFTFIPSITSGSDNHPVFSGSPGDAVFNTVYANVNAIGSSTFNSINVTNGITGTLFTAAQPNITSVGHLSSLIVNGDINTGTIHASEILIGGSPVVTSATTFRGGIVALDTEFSSNVIIDKSLTVNGNLTLSNFYATNIGGTLTTASQPNITSVGDLINLKVNNNITVSGNVSATYLSGTLTTGTQTLTKLTVTTPITGNITGSSVTVTGANQGAIKQVGLLNNLSVSGTIDAASDIHFSNSAGIRFTDNTYLTTTNGLGGVTPGPTGPQGPTGPASTVVGPTGPAGANSTVIGPTGPQGAIGPTGPAGASTTNLTYLGSYTSVYIGDMSSGNRTFSLLVSSYSFLSNLKIPVVTLEYDYWVWYGGYGGTGTISLVSVSNRTPGINSTTGQNVSGDYLDIVVYLGPGGGYYSAWPNTITLKFWR